MAERVQRVNKPLVVFLLFLQMVGTLAAIGYSFWLFMNLHVDESEERVAAFGYMFLGSAWFLVLGWGIRSLAHPKPSE